MSRGRKTLDGAIVRRVQVTLDDETVERAKALGDGNLSQGIREAVRGTIMATKAVIINRCNDIVGTLSEDVSGNEIEVAGALTREGDPVNVRTYRISRSKRNLARPTEWLPATRYERHGRVFYMLNERGD